MKAINTIPRDEYAECLFESMQRMNEPQGFINIEKPVTFLRHEPTHSQFSVYKKINRFQRFMIRICFGLKYIKI